MTRRIAFCAFAAIVLVGVAWSTGAAPAATVVAHLDGGGSDAAPVTDVVDAYTGKAGDGWAGPWLKATSTGSIAATVMDATPFDGGGNYLNYLLTSNGQNGRGAVARSYASGIDLEEDHTIRFKYRIEEDLSTFTDLVYDTFQLFDWTSVRNNTTTSVRWAVACYPLDTGAGIVPGTWVASNGTYDGNATPVDTGIPLQQGVIYDFAITVRSTSRWDLVIDDGTTVFDSRNSYPDGMGWRSSATTVGSYVNFLARASHAEETRQFSIDDLTIAGAGMTPFGGMTSVAARFTHGNDDATYPDAYHGVAGDGWRKPWTDATSGAVTNHAVVSPGDFDFNEVKPGGGAYLRFSANTSGGGASNTTVTRNYKTTAAPGIDWSREHTVQFTMRIDEDVDNLFLFTDADDKYTAFNAPTAANGTGTACIWQVAAMAAESAGVTAEDVGKWLFFDGDHAGSGANVNTQIAIVTGGIYDFTISVDPATLTYDAVISDGTTTWDSRTSGYANGLGWRSTAIEVGGYLCFGARGNSFEDTRAFSLDDVIITQSQQTPGDADGNGTVDAADAAALAANWLGSGAGWAGGDFNNDGLTDDLDLAILAANWTTGAADAAVPEPGALLLLTAGLGASAMRRSRFQERTGALHGRVTS